MIIPVNTGECSYDITLERGALAKAGEIFGIRGKVLIVTDNGVPKAYSETVAEQFPESYIFTFEQGEGSKKLDTYEQICQCLLEHSFTRSDAVIAVGGGVAGDMSGFAAATYMRGIDFYNIPTTLLSQVDSSIGGKTAIDFMGVKNILGAFHQPKSVLIDPEVLSTLPERHIRNGLAEALKMGMTFSEELFDIFCDESYMKKIDKIIELSLLIKRNVVQQDEKEAGLRRSLNFGHTVGHGIEGACGLQELLHGECVALGILPMCSSDVKEKVLTVYKNIGLPCSYDVDKTKVREILSHDKKAGNGKITLVKCDRIGSFYFETATVDEIMNLI